MEPKKKNALAQYLEDEGIMKSVFATKIGVSYPSFIKYTQGTGMPSIPIAYKIENVSRGRVPVASWLPKDHP
jgi:DNA-binding XRE family transcriptional regulator